MLRPAMKALLRFGWIFSKDERSTDPLFCEPITTRAKNMRAKKMKSHSQFGRSLQIVRHSAKLGQLGTLSRVVPNCSWVRRNAMWAIAAPGVWPSSRANPKHVLPLSWGPLGDGTGGWGSSTFQSGNGVAKEKAGGPFSPKTMKLNSQLDHLKVLEAESVYILREAAAEFARPVMLYSIGKDSSVMLRLAQKAFYPGKIPFPLLHIDTSYKFPEMIEFRDSYIRQIGAELIVHTNRKALDDGATPYALGTQKCCGFLKTRSLLDALEEGGFDAAFGGARRDEEKSRAKERVYSFRDSLGQWDPKNQRPELWNLYNSRHHKGESIRVFPLSNWSELDVWLYIHVENIPIVPLYLAKEREVIVRDDSLLLIQSIVRLLPGEKPTTVKCRMRSLGCVPCTGAIRSNADTVPAIIKEMLSFRRSERENRVIDHDEEGSMELKKREGYF